MSILFKNLAKAATDLLDLDTDSENKVSLTTATANGVKYTAEATANGDALSGKIGASFKLDSGITVKKLNLNNKGKLETEITVDKTIPDVQFKVKANLNQAELEKGSVAVQYTQSNYKADLEVSNSANFKTSLCVASDGWQFGGNGSLTYDSNKGEVSNHGYGLGASYSADGSTGAVTLSKCPKCDSLLTSYQVSFYRQHSPALAFAATLGGKVSGDSAALELGSSYTVDASSTLHTKLSVPAGGCGTVALNYEQKLSDNTQLNLSSTMCLNGSDAPTFGLGLELGL